MGLNVCSSKVTDDDDYDYESFDCWAGPYSAFTRWRHALCRAAGWHLEEHVEGYHTFLWPREVNIHGLTEENFLGQWDRIPEDPLVLLVAHSDCDGVLPPEALMPLAERLEELARMLPDKAHDPEYQGDTPRGTYDGILAATLRFSEGLRRSSEAGHRVVFG